MIKSYLKILFRNLERNKGYTFINIAGLSFGIACVLVIALYVFDELNYDRFHDDYENIYRLEWHSGNPQTRTPHPMAQAMVRDFPEVESAVTLSPLWGAGLTRQTFSIRNLDKDLKFDEKNVLSVDTTFFKVFSFPLVKGDPEHALKKSGGILISQAMAQKYFGSEDPIGRQLAINNDSTLLEVTGVFQDVPRQSHFHFDFLISYNLLKLLEDPESEYYTWKDFGHYNYIRLHPEADVKELEKRLMTWVLNYLDVTREQMDQVIANGDHFALTPMSDIHLKSHILWELEANGNIDYIYILIASALLILIIACTNFVNLSTARSAERAKEIGIRKTIGAYKYQLVAQFIGESIVISIISILLGGLIIEMALPFFSNLSGKPLTNEFITQPAGWLFLILTALLIGIIAGAYPSFILSSIKPGQILKGKFTTSHKGNSLRKVLVVLQFTISMILLSSTFIIFSQLDYLQNRPLGFSKENVMVIPIHSDVIEEKFEVLKNELNQISGVKSVSAVSNTPGFQFNQNPLFLVDDPEKRIDVFQNYVDYEVLNVLDLELAEGRFFNEADKGKRNYFVINETAAQQLQLEEATGSELGIELNGETLKGTVIGVIKDFNFQSLHQPVRPLIMHYEPYYSYALIKFQTHDLNGFISHVENEWLAVNDDFEFQFSFLDDNLNQQYHAENQMGNVFAVFAVIAIIIACLGLFGLAALNFHQRTKEVGVRKILGASISSLLVTLNKEFTILVIIAIVIAIPVTWYIMDQWLENFNFKVAINPLSFLFGGITLLSIAFVTLSYLTHRTSRINPVETLKEE